MAASSKHPNKELEEANKDIVELEASTKLMQFHEKKLYEAQRNVKLCVSKFEGLKSIPLDSANRVEAFEEFLSYQTLNPGNKWEGEVIVDGESEKVKKDRLELVQKIVRDYGATRRVTINIK